MLQESRKNWSGNYTYAAERLQRPQSLSDVQDLVRSGGRLKALGARHSFNGIADTRGDQISLENFKEMKLDSGSGTVKMGAGVRYGELAAYLDQEGHALHNMASLPHISVAGACATGTHGSGSGNGNLSTAVCALEMVTGNAEVVSLSRKQDGEKFSGAVIALGALGVVTSVTLDVEPTFDVAQAVYLDLPFSALERNLEEIFATGYSVSLFTEWQGSRATQTWVKKRGADLSFEPELFGAKLAAEKLHPIAGYAAESCTEQLGVPGPWQERLPHFRMDHTPSSGDELQSEFFVPRESGYQAISAVEQLRDRITPLLFVSEFRTIAADQLWMSPCYRRPSLAIHFTWKPEWAAVKELLPEIEERLAPFQARPHWAKLFTKYPAALYPKLAEFAALMQQYDPAGKFRNDYLDNI
jgi:xylitol oxidase